jgi:hypothetical protein
LPIISILISSAKRTNFSSWIFKGESFVHNKNKRGPRTDPWGTPSFYFLMQGFINLLVFYHSH